MQSFLILILAISGLSWAITKSSVLKPLREYISKERIFYISCIKNPHSFIFTIKYTSYSFLDSLMGCENCMGFWSALICYLLHKYHLDIILFAFAGTMICGLVIGLINFLNKK